MNHTMTQQAVLKKQVDHHREREISDQAKMEGNANKSVHPLIFKDFYTFN